ncbi:hypothetical protein IEO21_05159 [Rhodonia placenta]|uniref:Uncharacterized protein n=1 Tax=Rhodonia placenta TaxID=104341 RepID=A0A8H7P2U3_9APHY|nr:hypothetical protein IEO21_05159 [Postia placenta]
MKALPTVSVSSTNVNSVNHSRVLASPPDLSDAMGKNFIPFPSSPIPCPAGRHIDGFDEYDADNETEILESLEVYVEQPPALSDSQNVPRRRSRSCLATSSFHSDNAGGVPQAPSSSRRASKSTHSRLSPALRASKSQPRAQGTSVRRHSVSAGNAEPTAPRPAKRGKKISDVQYLALVHRSIALRARMEDPRDAFVAQDVALARRLWQTLVEHGLSPIPLGPAVSGPYMTAMSEKEGSDVPETPPPSPTFESELAAVPCSPLPEPATDTPPVLSMPQLVASLTLRYRERCSSRSRSSSGKVDSVANEDKTRRPSSALARVTYSSASLEPDTEDASVIRGSSA